MDLNEFEKKANIEFKNKELLKQAFIHRSYLNENPGEKLDHNERLEFLGDAVLELSVTDYLYKAFPEKPEGELTALRAALVNTNSISDCAQELGMNEFLYLSKGEEKSTGKSRQYILANAFEALIGSIYEDGGYESADDFIAKHLIPKIDTIIKDRLWQDSKSRFQEIAQERESITPSYTVLDEAGPDHEKTFKVGLYLGEQLISEGEGRSKQEAEQNAAQNGLSSKGWLD